MPLTIDDTIRIRDYYDEKGCVEGDITYFPWDSGGICWNNNPFCWDDVAFIKEIFGHLETTVTDDQTWIDTYEKLDEPKKKRFITLVAKVKGYKEYKETKEVKDVKLTAKDIKLTVDTVLNINVNVEKDTE